MTLEMCSICPNLILVSGVYTTPPTGDDKLKLLVAAVGWRSLGGKPDLTALDCFPSQWKAGDAVRFPHITWADFWVLAVLS